MSLFVDGFQCGAGWAWRSVSRATATRRLEDQKSVTPAVATGRGGAGVCAAAIGTDGDGATRHPIPMPRSSTAAAASPMASDGAMRHPKRRGNGGSDSTVAGGKASFAVSATRCHWANSDSRPLRCACRSARTSGDNAPRASSIMSLSRIAASILVSNHVHAGLVSWLHCIVCRNCRTALCSRERTVPRGISRTLAISS